MNRHGHAARIQGILAALHRVNRPRTRYQLKQILPWNPVSRQDGAEATQHGPYLSRLVARFGSQNSGCLRRSVELYFQLKFVPTPNVGQPSACHCNSAWSRQVTIVNKIKMLRVKHLVKDRSTFGRLMEDCQNIVVDSEKPRPSSYTIAVDTSTLVASHSVYRKGLPD